MLSLEQSYLDHHQCPQLTTIISNAAPLPQALKERIIDHFGEGLLHETYGSTEAGIVTNLRPNDQLRKQQCVGQPFPCTFVKIVDDDGDECPADQVGELFSLSPYLFNGYWDRPKETREAFHDGWVTVGDMARRDEDGYLYIVDRKKDMVISGGFNIYPRETEEILVQHVSIAEAAVVGVPDEKWGEAVKAVAVLHEGNEPSEALAKEIIAFTKGKLAGYKRPKSLDFIKDEDMPRTPTGKILHRILREKYGKWSDAQ